MDADPPLVTKAPRVRMRAESQPRAGFFENDQFETVVKHLPDFLAAPVRALKLSGWRVNEILSRQDRHLDLRAGVLTIHPDEAKDKTTGRTLPLEPELHALLTAAGARKREIEKAKGKIIPWVFCTPEGDKIKYSWLRSQWARACRNAGVHKWLHDLRRTAVRRLNRAGIARSTAMALIGHRTEAIYRRYSITDETVLREAITKWQRWARRTRPGRSK
jgi:integrase